MGNLSTPRKKKAPAWFNIGILIGQQKDPCQPTSISWKILYIFSFFTLHPELLRYVLIFMLELSLKKHASGIRSVPKCILPARKLTCLLKRDHFKRKGSSANHHVFGGTGSFPEYTRLSTRIVAKIPKVPTFS